MECVNRIEINFEQNRPINCSFAIVFKSKAKVVSVSGIISCVT